MSTPLRRFPDVQRVLVEGLEVIVGAGSTGIETPVNLIQVLPFVRVVRAGGSSNRLHDLSSVDVDVFHGRYVDGEALAERIRQYLCGPPPPFAVLDRVECDSAPQELPWGDPGIRRFNASYTAIARRTAAF